MVTPHAASAGHAVDSIDRYIASVPIERRDAYTRLVTDIDRQIDPRFAPTVAYGMPTWVVPHEIYPAGYHCDPTIGVPFLSLANQSRYIAYYHMGIYSDPATLDWFTEAFAKTGLRLNMGRSCIRFTNPSRIPFDLMAELTARISVDDYLAMYERTLKR